LNLLLNPMRLLLPLWYLPLYWDNKNLMNKKKQVNSLFLKASLLGMLAFSSICTVFGQTISSLERVNTPYDEQHPVLSPAGILYFTVAFHPENENGTADPGDIWSSTPSESENFQTPVKVRELSSAGYD